MKKIVLLSFTLLGMVFTGVSQTATKVAEAQAVSKDDGAKIEFETETIDYGTIENNADGNREFKFTNTGNAPLVITNAKGSCGCTVPTWPKEAIAPGESSVIKVHYATNRTGAFSKSVTLISNAVNAPTKVLHIKGTVNPPKPADK
ncbi:hypothetical protein GCM10007962_03310 [Yeosuana aromativorans]|uniref:DUF1573 domain-containing protein n=1 Tax=Yeosuana aromativorans TaxID=288019 RepID=A0A8J3BJ21_9FLAO|nr:DUF1573 domain-containing protein [Yeosuana aromativorans]GGK12293.1 hypothetical protein GCM10007962_03310 [Yeosuana aromativorans]